MTDPRTAGIGAVMIAALAAAAYGAPPAAAPASAPAPEPNDPAAKARKIIAEEQRQAYVNRRVDDVVVRFRELVADLRSNGLLDEGQGGELGKAIDVLGKLNEKHVRAAMTHLRTALAAGGNRKHLEAADGEVDVVVRDLTELLKLAKAIEAQALLRQELKTIIKQEERLHETSKTVGRQALENKLKSDLPIKDAAAAQREIAARVERLPALFKEAVAAAEDDEKTRFTKAAADLKDKRVDAQLKAAAQSLDAQSFVEAVTGQKDAIEALKAIEKALDPSEEPENPITMPSNPLAEAKMLVERIAELEKKQMDLRMETKKHADKKESVKPEAKPQEMLKAETKEVAEMPAAKEPAVQMPLEMAQKEMEKAAENLKADKPEAAQEAQMKAEMALAKARMAAEAQAMALEMQAAAMAAQNKAEMLIAEQMKVMNETNKATPTGAMDQAMPQAEIGKEAKMAAAEKAPPAAQMAFEKAAMAAEKAAMALEAGKKEEAMMQQAAALEALQMAAQAAAEAAKDPGMGMMPAMAMGMMPGMPGMPGMMPGMEMGMGMMPSMKDAMANNQTMGDPMEGERTFNKTGVAGSAGSREKSTWQTLGKKDRGALNEKYVRELPLEYRELLKDYYRALSK